MYTFMGNSQSRAQGIKRKLQGHRTDAPVQPHDDRPCHPFRYAAISGHQSRPKAGDHARSFSLYQNPVSREEDEFIVAHVNRMGNEWTRISQLFGE
jgi:hypothetical protein